MSRAISRAMASVVLVALGACHSLCGLFGDVVTCSLTGADNIVQTQRVPCAGGANAGDLQRAFPAARPHELAACHDECASAYAAR